jgi:hypothetical protein
MSKPNMRKQSRRKSFNKNTVAKKASFKKKFSKKEVVKHVKIEEPVSEEEIQKMLVLLDQISQRPDYHTHEKFATLRYPKLKAMNLTVSELNTKFNFGVKFLLEIYTPVEEILAHFSLDEVLKQSKFFNKIDGSISLDQLREAGVKAEELLDKHIPFEILYREGGYAAKELRVGGIDKRLIKSFLDQEDKHLINKRNNPPVRKKKFYKAKAPKKPFSKKTTYKK